MRKPIHTLTVYCQALPTAHWLQAIAQLGFSEITEVSCVQRYYLEGDLTAAEQQLLAEQLLTNPVTDRADWQAKPEPQQIEVALRPGVTDPVAEHILQGAELLGVRSLQRAATGQCFYFKSKQPLSEAQLHLLAKRLFVNPVIQHYALGEVAVQFPETAHIAPAAEIVPVRALAKDELIKLSQQRRLALNGEEMLAIQAYYNAEQREPTDVELEAIAQTWSEHCSHKTFRATIHYGDEVIPGLLKSYIRKATETINAPWVASAFVDNAGIIDFDAHYQLAFKVETHNHPSAIEPFGGANTGVGGVMRDVLGVSAKPIANTDIFCFGPLDLPPAEIPEGSLHPQRIQAGVVAGVEDYGNKTGVPTVNGAIYYDAGYTANPLVYCGCVGLLPSHSHPSQAKVGDRIIVLGGRTGRDGLRGATFSSMAMDAQTGEVAGASVQIGNPIIAKGLIEVVTRARDAKLYNAITDCGAGGLSSAVGEMASKLGAEVNLAKVPLKYAGLSPWEIWLSEAQERMVLSVPAHQVAKLQQICHIFNIELSDIGYFTESGYLQVSYKDNVVLNLKNKFLFDGMPQRTLQASKPKAVVYKNPVAELSHPQALLKLLAHPNIRSKEAVIRLYDHEVQGATVVKPLIGINNDGPADACVLKPLVTEGKRGLVLANGINPELGKVDAYAMACSVIDEAIRNAVAVGANPDRIAILDNFCWGDPNKPETLGALVEACKACYDAALHYQAPFISGKDSLNNEYYTQTGERHAIPSTLLISALGIIENIENAVTMDFKQPGNLIYLVGTTHNELAGSHYLAIGGSCADAGQVPILPTHAPVLYRGVHQAMQQKLIAACHDLSEGGLSVALAEMCIAGRLGCEINLPTGDATTLLFSESNARFLIEIKPEHKAEFTKLVTDAHYLGQVSADLNYQISQDQQTLIHLPINALVQAWQNAQ